VLRGGEQVPGLSRHSPGRQAAAAGCSKDTRVEALLEAPQRT